MLAQTHYGRWLPPLLSEHGGQIDHLIDVLHVFMAVLFVGWGIFFVYCLTKYRQRPGRTARYEPVKGTISKYSEVGVGAFEAFLLIGLSMPLWAWYKNEPPDEKERFEVRVIAEQFQWNFHYPGKDGKFGPTRADLISPSNPIGLVETHPDAADDIVSVNEFHVPVGKPIYVRLTTKDVIHSFAIPTMRVKQDAIPGMEIPIWFTVKEDARSDVLREQMTQEFPIRRANWYRLRHHISTVDYKDADGQVLLAQGDDLGATYQAGRELLDKLRNAGVTELRMQPRTPLEVICAQLCGNSHFSMKAMMVTYDDAGFEAWVEEKSEVVEFDF